LFTRSGEGDPKIFVTLTILAVACGDDKTPGPGATPVAEGVELVTTLGTEGMGDGQLHSPTGIAIGNAAPHGHFPSLELFMQELENG